MNEKIFFENQAQFQQMVETAPTAIIVLQEDSIVFCNQKFADILGYKKKNELVDKQFATLVNKSYINYFSTWLKQLEKFANQQSGIEIILLKNNDTPTHV